MPYVSYLADVEPSYYTDELFSITGGSSYTNRSGYYSSMGSTLGTVAVSTGTSTTTAWSSYTEATNASGGDPITISRTTYPAAQTSYTYTESRPSYVLKAQTYTTLEYEKRTTSSSEITSTVTYSETSSDGATYTTYIPFSNSTLTYGYIYSTTELDTYSNIKTTSSFLYKRTGNNASYTYNIECIGTDNSQLLLAITTQTHANIYYSDYDVLLMQDGFFSFSTSDILATLDAGSYSGEQPVTYTLTYDSISYLLSTSTWTSFYLDLVSAFESNKFLYGYLTSSTITAEYSSSYAYETTGEYTSALGNSYATSLAGASSSSTSFRQYITTVSSMEYYYEAFHPSESFVVSSLSVMTTTLTSDSYYSVFNFITQSGDLSYPIYYQKGINRAEIPTRQTFYTEEATYGNFVNSVPFSIVYNNYSPDAVSNIIVAVVQAKESMAANLYGPSEDTVSGNNACPLYMSVFIGTVTSSQDRQISSITSVTINQSTSGAIGTTNAYQSVSYTTTSFIGTHPFTTSTTTRDFITRSCAISFTGQASSVMLTARTFVDNYIPAYFLPSYVANTSLTLGIYYVPYQPQHPINASEVYYSNGLFTTANYNLSGKLINAYTSLGSTYIKDSSIKTFAVRNSRAYSSWDGQYDVFDSYGNSNYIFTREIYIQDFGSIFQI